MVYDILYVRHNDAHTIIIHVKQMRNVLVLVQSV